MTIRPARVPPAPIHVIALDDEAPPDDGDHIRHPKCGCHPSAEARVLGSPARAYIHKPYLLASRRVRVGRIGEADVR